MTAVLPESAQETEPSSPEPGRRTNEPALGRRKLIAIAVGVIVIVAAVSSFVLLTQKKETVKIGVIVGESSIFSHAAEVNYALEMAADDINKWGGIGGAEVELVTVETSIDETEAVAAFQSVEEEHHPLLYITVGCELMSVIGPVADEIGAPLVGLGSAPGLTEGLDWIFRFYVSAAEEAAVAAGMLADLEVKTLGILHSVDPHGCGINDALVDEFLAIGETIESEGFDLNSDISERISNLSDNEAIYCVGSCGEIINMMLEIRNSGYEGYLMVASCGSIPQMWNLPQMQGVYVSAPLIYRAENIYAQDFMERFESTYEIPPTHHGAVVFDTMYLVRGLMENLDLTRGVLKEQLDAGFVFTGTVGILRIDEGEHDFSLAVFPAIIAEEGLRYL